MYGKQRAFFEKWWWLVWGGGSIGQLSPYPPHCADLELALDQAFVYIFPVHFNTVYTYCLRPRRATFGVTDAPSTWGQQQECLSRWIPLFVKVQGWSPRKTALCVVARNFTRIPNETNKKKEKTTPRCCLNFWTLLFVFSSRSNMIFPSKIFTRLSSKQ